jgi:hypothetical protein
MDYLTLQEMYGNGAQIGIGLTITKKAQYQIP